MDAAPTAKSRRQDIELKILQLLKIVNDEPGEWFYPMGAPSLRLVAMVQQILDGLPS